MCVCVQGSDSGLVGGGKAILYLGFAGTALCVCVCVSCAVSLMYCLSISLGCKFHGHIPQCLCHTLCVNSKSFPHLSLNHSLYPNNISSLLQSWAWQTLLKTAELSVLIIIIVPVLYFLTLIYPPLLKDLFIPAFFYCWPAGRAVTVAMIQVLQRGMHRRTNSFRLKAISLAVMFLCFLFTW